MSGPALARAHAKLNWTLDVHGRGLDGYHPIRSVMQRLLLHDTVEMEFSSTPGLRLSVRGDQISGVPDGPDNIVIAAAERLLRENAAIERLAGRGLSIVLTKNIPSQAGLGGGSSDAAAALRALDRLLNRRLPAAALARMAAQIGSDVPFFLHGGPALVTGVGDQIESLSPAQRKRLGRRAVVLMKPPAGVSTAHAYAALDAQPDRVSGVATSELIAWASDESPRSNNPPIGNDFESILPDLASDVADALASFRAMAGSIPGCAVPHLCGSGSAAFCFTDGPAAASELADLARSLGRVWITETIIDDE